MGMFDEFVGEIKCPLCGEMHKFSEQTKDYDCVMDTFKLGDYFDKANKNYTYPIKAYCYKYKKIFDANIIVLKGQIVKILSNDEFKLYDENITNFENIEEGLGWKHDYLERCKEGIGCNNDFRMFDIPRYEWEIVNWNEHPKKIGDNLFALGNDWTITGVYKEIPKGDKKDSWDDFIQALCKDNYIYTITSKLGNRIARVTEDRIRLMYDNGFKPEFDVNHENDYFVWFGCKLIKL